jgi:hypothetical protein
LSLVAAFVGILFGYIPEPKVLSWWLLMIALMALGIKFVTADLLSSDGFCLSKAATDMSLAFLAAITSLATAQSVGHEILFTGPPMLVVTGDPAVSPTRWDAESAAWSLSGLALIFFMLCLLSAKWGRAIRPTNKIGTAKSIISKTVCATLGGLSFSSYFVMIFFKA